MRQRRRDSSLCVTPWIDLFVAYHLTHLFRHLGRNRLDVVDGLGVGRDLFQHLFLSLGAHYAVAVKTDVSATRYLL